MAKKSREAVERGFEYPDITTSDVCFRAHGKDLAEMFANAGLALMEVVVDIKQVEPRESRKIRVQGNDLKSLMFDFLTELIYYIDAENLAFSRFDLEVDEKALTVKGEAWGELIDHSRHDVKTHVKACTYHKMEISKKDRKWTAQVILDI